MKLGVVGEDPSDAESLINLLKNHYGEHKHQFSILLHYLTGDQLKTERARKLIRAEYQSESPAYVIYTRDLDDLSSNTAKVKDRQKEFDSLQPFINYMGVFLLNVYELETLILADINSFNSHYGVNLGPYAKPTYIEEPKEELKVKTNQLGTPYHERNNPEVFNVLNASTIAMQCDYFRNFLAELKLKGC